MRAGGLGEGGGAGAGDGFEAVDGEGSAGELVGGGAAGLVADVEAGVGGGGADGVRAIGLSSKEAWPESPINSVAATTREPPVRL